MSTRSGSLSIVYVQMGAQKLSIIQSSGVSDVQGLLISTEVNVKIVMTFGIVHYVMGVCRLGASIKWDSTVQHRQQNNVLS